MTTIIIDRRENPGGKHLPDRQRFLERNRAEIAGAVGRLLGEKNITDIMGPNGSVKVNISPTAEPRLGRIGGKKRSVVLTGNDVYVKNDEIHLDRSGSGTAAGGDEPGTGGGGEDPFKFILTREEFLNALFDNLELPNMDRKKAMQLLDDGYKRAGYATSGQMPNLALARTMRQSLMRRVALHRPKDAEIESLQEKLARAECSEDERVELIAQIESLYKQRCRVPYIDTVDLRYRRFEVVRRPVSQAVMYCLMDVSGSLTEHMKDLAKRFFLLIHVFLQCKYERVEIVFIRHTDEARVVDENTFFRATDTGGTVVSCAFNVMKEHREKHYPLENWNVYVAQSSDGDNMLSDNDTVAKILPGIMPTLQYCAYLEVGNPGSMSQKSSLWVTYEKLNKAGLGIGMARVTHKSEVFPAFARLFQKKSRSNRRKERSVS